MEYELTLEAARLLVPEFEFEMLEEEHEDNTGGNCMVSFYVLKDGRCLTLTDESICLWEHQEDFYDEDLCVDGLLASADLEFKDVYIKEES